MDITFHKKFKKTYAKQPKSVQACFKAQLIVFGTDPYDSTLNNHALRGELAAYRSINITGDIRAWYEVVGDEVVFMKIGSHSKLYG